MTRTVLFISVVFTIVALSIASTRYHALEIPLVPPTESPLWQVEVHGEPLSSKVNVRLEIPSVGQGAQIDTESFRGEGVAAGTVALNGSRKLVWKGSIDVPQFRGLYYSVSLRTGLPEKVSEVSQSLPLIESWEVSSGLKKARKAAKRGKEARANLIACLSRKECGDSDPFHAFRDEERELAFIAAALLESVGTDARVARGFQAERVVKKAKFRHWLQVKVKKTWKDIFLFAADPLTRDNVLFWDYPNYQVEALKNIDLHYSVLPLRLDWARLDKAVSPSSVWSVLTLYDVPASTRAAYRVLLLVPVGGLVIALLRSICGLPMLGTFMPILLALAFRETGFGWGLSLLIAVVILGLLIRASLTRLRLLLVPRLAATLSVVVLLIVGISSASYYAGFLEGLSVTLFPLVIITMVIERMSITWEEVGAARSLLLLFNSLIGASLGYLAMFETPCSYWFFHFPELILLVLACILLAGRYTGYRLLELYRFRTFAKEGV